MNRCTLMINYINKHISRKSYRCIFGAHVSYTTAPTASTSKTSKTVPKWLQKTKTMLVKEIKAENKMYSELYRRKSAQCNLIRYALKDDYADLIAYTHAYLDSLSEKSSSTNGDDEIFSVVLLLAARRYEYYSASTSMANSRESLQIFFSLANLMEQMPIQGEDTKAAWILLLDRLERWIDIRTMDDKSSDIDDVRIDLHRKLSSQGGLGPSSYTYNRFLFTNDDQSIIRIKERELLGRNVKLKEEEREWPYDEKVILLKGLMNPASSDQYHGSTYSMLDFNKKNCMKLFEEQLRLENDRHLFVKNFSRNQNEPSAELLIDRWKWKDNLLECLKLRALELRQYPLKDFMEVVDHKVCAIIMLSVIKSVCAQGDELIPATIFQQRLASPVLNLINRMFVRKISKTADKIYDEVFAEYARYFSESELTRQYTAREWWMHCTCNAHLKSQLELPFSNFGAEIREQLGTFLTSIAMEACRMSYKREGVAEAQMQVFSFKDVVNEEEMNSEDEILNVTKMVRLCNPLLEVFSQHQFEYMVFPTEFLPMKVPPRPWLDWGDGGPHYTTSYNVLRAHPDYPRVNVTYEMRKRLRSRKQARPVFDALNDLGLMPWRINKRMLDIVLQVFKMTSDSSKEEFLHNLSIPLHSSCVTVPDYGATFGKMSVEDLPLDEWRNFAKAKYESLKKRNELNSLWCWLLYRLTMANHYKDDVLFFPHSMDFRGRVYPISPYLNHMGDDLNRSLLTFAEGRPLGPDGLRWLKLHCINLTGLLKHESIDDRLVFAESVQSKILDSAENPLDGEMWWTKSDEPWQTLAACFEIRNVLHSGDAVNYVSHIPIHQDGSCNGLQHYAALGRDQDGGKEVNLIPLNKPSDVYMSVAHRVEQKRLEDENSLNEGVQNAAKLFRSIMPNPVARKIIKQTVMTTVYGVTMSGARRQIERQLKAIGVESDERIKFAAYLADKTFSSLNDAFTSSMKLKDWFRLCATEIVDLMQSVEWETPLGLPVFQPYLETKILENKVYREPKRIKQVNAFPPNYVHSLDSTHMMLTALHCRRLGITFAAVHDCFWTHACSVPEMNRICREQFVLLHNEPLVKRCAEFFRQKYLPTWLRNAMTAEEVQKVRNTFSVRVRPGSLDLNLVKDSVYFFS